MARSCPNCKKEIKAKGRVCPRCRVKVKWVEYVEAGQKYGAFLLDQDSLTPRQKELKQVAEQVNGRVPDEHRLLITGHDENPAIYFLETNHMYQVVYHGWAPIGPIYCPNCTRRLFDNNTASAQAHQNHRCDRCKYTIQYIFEHDWLT